MADRESATRRRGQRAGLDRATVVAAGRELLREHGSSGITMRGVARRLGVAPNALYSHVGDKTELVDLVLDEVLAGVPIPGEERLVAAPVEAVREVMLSSYDVLLEHAELVPHFLARQGARGEHARRLGELTMAALVRAGLDEAAAASAMRVLIVNTIGFAAFSAGGTGADGPLTAGEVRANYELALDWLLASVARDR